jgi:hypothetical protein
MTQAGPVLRLIVSLAAIGSAGCFRSAPPPTARETEAARTISREEILRSGALDAWQALRHFGTFLEIKENRRGDGLVYQRGRNSLLLSSQLMLIVDEVQMADFQYLKQIPAETVEFIRILGGAEGTARYGTGAGNGVIVVRTGPPPMTKAS